MLKNDKCSDIFKNVKQHCSDYEVISYKDALNYKFALKRFNMTLNRLKMVINMKLAEGDVFIKLVLQRIEINRKLFMLDIELGRATFIVKDLSMDHFP